MDPNDRRLLEKARRLIAACALFRGLGQPQLAQLLDRVRLRKCAAGEAVFLMGDSGANLMAVVEGSVQISVPSPEGKEITLAIMHPGEVFGEIGLLDAQERSADARAMSACVLAVLERRDVLPVFNENPRAYLDVVILLCERIRRTTTQMAEVALLDLPARLAKALLRAAGAERSAAVVGAKDSAAAVGPKDQVRLSQRELGTIVGATRESVNKCLRNWQRSGIVEVESAAIRIKDARALQTLADLLNE